MAVAPAEGMVEEDLVEGTAAAAKEVVEREAGMAVVAREAVARAEVRAVAGLVGAATEVARAAAVRAVEVATEWLHKSRGFRSLRACCANHQISRPPNPPGRA